jgi:AcrR family transcriptional regulator
VPRKRLTRAERQAETRARLLDAAVRVCARRGLADATIEEISEEAGYTRGAVYSNFESKENLLLAVFEERIEPRLRSVLAPMIEATGARQQGLMLTSLVGSLLKEERAYLQLLVEFWGVAARNRTVGRRFAEVRRRRRELVSEMIGERLTRRGERLENTTDELAAVLVALTTGVLFEAIVDRDLDARGVHQLGFELVARGSPATKTRRSAV